MDESFMKEWAILPLIASMALPAVVSMIVNSLYNIVDSLFVAMISEQAMTAVSLVFPMQNFVNAVCIGFGVGLNAIISICLGAGQKGTADVAATHGVFLAVIHGLVMTAGCIWAVPSFLRAFTQDAGLIDLGLRYAVIVFAFSTILSVDLVYEKMFQAVGRMQVTMAGLSLGCLVNIIGDPILIFGLGPIPAMGIEGAAWATGLGQTVNLLFYAVVCHWRPLRVEVCRRHLHWDIELDKRLYGIGIPAALNMGLSSVFLVALNHLLAPFSPTYIFILGVYYKLQTFLSMPTNGIIQGVRPLIGYNYGAGELGRVRRIYRTTLVLNGLVMAAGLVICLAVPDVLMGWFTSREETIAAGASALGIIAWGFVPSALSITASGALEGLGKGNPSFAITLLRYVVISLPAAWLLCRVYGPDGVWHAFWIFECLAALAAWKIYDHYAPAVTKEKETT